MTTGFESSSSSFEVYYMSHQHQHAGLFQLSNEHWRRCCLMSRHLIADIIIIITMMMIMIWQFIRHRKQASKQARTTKVSKVTERHCAGTVQSQGGRVWNVKQVGFESRLEDSYRRSRRNMSMKSLQRRHTPGTCDECRTAPDGRRPVDQATDLSHWPALWHLWGTALEGAIAKTITLTLAWR